MRCGLRFALPSVLLVLSLALPSHAAGNEVTGFYRVTQVTDLGKQVRVTLHIRLANNTRQDLSITRVGIHPSAAPVAAPRDMQSSWAYLEQRQSAGMDQVFVVSRAEYTRWTHGGHPALRVEFQPAGGATQVRTIPLRPERDRRAP
ncbi:MAG TPA: hypothetical protein VLW54_12010 [Candidatus Acidoferrales bacterium]|nr:hypothetical protein [Candidatus Acidoferrales bacterium]